LFDYKNYTFGKRCEAKANAWNPHQPPDPDSPL
jgi:hypothetical protein